MQSEADVYLIEFKDKYYRGNPFYVTGNALLHSVSDKLSYEEKSNLDFSHGIFVNMYKEFSSKYRNERGHMVGNKIPDIKTYEDFFRLRRKPFSYAKMDEYDLPPIYKYGGHKIQKRRFLTFYVFGLDEDKTGIFDGIQVGGLRNYGFGKLEIVDHKRVNIKNLDFEIKEADSVELITPICIKSEISNTKEFDDLPSFMGVGNKNYDFNKRVRTRKEIILESGDEKQIKTIDHGQVFRFVGDNSNKKYTALKGIQGILNHSKYGYGEFMLR